MPRTFLDALADAVFESQLATRFSEAARCAEEDGDIACSEALRDASRSIHVRSILHRAEAGALMSTDEKSGDSDPRG